MIYSITVSAILISWLCSHNQVSAFPSVSEPNETVLENEWDYLLFSQQWPPTACAEWKEVNSSHKCNAPANAASWTVHGIWPTEDGHNLGPSFCNKSWHFNVNQVQEIMPLLLHYWPNLYSGTPGTNLWVHEWTKHGTCAASLPSLDDELKYFSSGVKWAQEYNVYKILADSAIIPSASSTYTVEDIEQAVLKGLGALPVLSCDLAKNDKKLYLQEVRLCFDKELKLKSCPAKSKSKLTHAERCPSGSQVFYLSMETAEQHSKTNPLKILAAVNALIGLTL